MTDVSSQATPTTTPRESGSQAWVALSIVVALLTLGIGCLVVSVIEKSIVGAALTVVGTIVGILGNALQAPSGIGSVIAQATGKKATPA